MSEHTFDPEVLELLGRIAADPESRLVQTPRGPLKRWLRGPEDVLSARQPGLTKLEQHLVSAYREQVGEILCEMCIARVARRGTLVVVDKSRRRDPSALEAATRRCASAVARSGVEDPVLAMLRLPHGDANSDLAVAAVHLRPNSLSRIALGFALFSEGRHIEALDAFAGVISHAATAVTRSLGHENQGMVLSARREYERAFAAYADACRATPDRVTPHMDQFAMSLQAGDMKRARETAVRLQEVPESSGLFDQVLAVMAEAKEEGTWTTTAASAASVRSLRESLPERARRICDALWIPS